MVNSNANALGVIFPNSYDTLVPELVGERLMASIPFASRYRMVDFILSSMVNCGIDNISLIVRKNYHSLMDHLGSGREWDLTRKNGGLNIVPPFAEKTVKVYNGRVEALASILDFLKSQKEKYVVMSDANIAVNFDFKALIEAHIASGADVTVAYAEEEIPAADMEAPVLNKAMYYTLDMEDGRVKNIKINSKEKGVQKHDEGERCFAQGKGVAEAQGRGCYEHKGRRTCRKFRQADGGVGEKENELNAQCRCRTRQQRERQGEPCIQSAGRAAAQGREKGEGTACCGRDERRQKVEIPGAGEKQRERPHAGSSEEQQDENVP